MCVHMWVVEVRCMCAHVGGGGDVCVCTCGWWSWMWIRDLMTRLSFTRGS